MSATYVVDILNERRFPPPSPKLFTILGIVILHLFHTSLPQQHSKSNYYTGKLAIQP